MTERCQVCLGVQHEPRFSKRGYDVVRCRGCGHLSLALTLSDEELAAIYGRAFFADGSYADYVRDKPILQRNFARFIEILRAYRPAGALFEVGAAYGFFLELAARHWRVAGLDISQPAVTFVRERLGLDVVCRDFLALPLPPASQDVVVMWDTIEHLRRPADYVAKVAQVLKPGGVFALTTGDAGSLVARLRGRRWRLYDPPFHLHYFTRETMTRLLERHGLAVDRLSPIGFHRSVDTMLHRVLGDGKPTVLRALYRLSRRTGLTTRSLYLNLYDIMVVVARRA